MMARSRTIFGPIWRWILFNEEALKLRERQDSKYIAMSYEISVAPESALNLIKNTLIFLFAPQKSPEWYSVSGIPPDSTEVWQTLKLMMREASMHI